MMRCGWLVGGRGVRGGEGRKGDGRGTEGAWGSGIGMSFTEMCFFFFGYFIWERGYAKNCIRFREDLIGDGVADVESYTVYKN